MQFGEEAKRLHSSLADANREFLEHVERHPHFLERSRFAALDPNEALLGYRLQAWPTFLDTAAVREITRVTVAVNRLLKSVPERFFGNDPEALAEYYGQEEKLARVIATLLGRPDHLESLLARGDFIQDASGLQCLEVNLSSNIGGWQTILWEALYRATPLGEFLRESGLRVATTDTLRVLFEHLIEHAVRAGLGQDGELNLLFAIPPEKLGQLVLRDIVDQAYWRHLEEARGWRGRVLVTSYEELAQRGDTLYLGDHRVHIVVEHYGSVVPREVLFPFLSGNLLVVNGPVSRVLDDRRNLALLSEYRDSDYFDAEERSVIHRHVPWTRFLVRDYTDYQGERVLLPDMLRERRERMVLKHVASARGEKVLIGAAMSDEAWEKAVGTAADEGRWIVQERIDSLPYWCQTGVVGCAPHDLVWGFFVFGDRYGGGFLRMKPSGSHGIVNAAQGAEEGILFEVDPSSEKEERP